MSTPDLSGSRLARHRREHRRAAARALVAAAVLALLAGCSADRSTTADPAPLGAPSATLGPWDGAAHGSASPAPTDASGTGGSTGAGSTGAGSTSAGSTGAGTSTPATTNAGRENAPGATAAPAGTTALGPVTDVPRLAQPLPATASARDGLVAGFPAAIVPVPDGTTIVSSSVAAQDDRLQVGLEASTAQTPADVLAHYLGALVAEGFAPLDSPAAAGSTATAFTRGAEGLVLTLRERMGGGTQLSVAGTLVAGG